MQVKCFGVCLKATKVLPSFRNKDEYHVGLMSGLELIDTPNQIIGAFTRSFFWEMAR